MAQGFSLKDDLFNADTVGRLAGHFEEAGVFKARRFQAVVMERMPPLELMARIQMIAEVLADFLPSDFLAAAQAIEMALPPPLDPTRRDDDFGHFIYAPLGVYAENHGLAEHRDRSLDLLEAVTQRFSMEYSIRAFLNHHQAATLERMQDWITHDHYHVRRLVSEGTRPKLPWGKAVGLTPDQTLPLLDALHGDGTRFVTRSVANHLNDLTKTGPDQVIARLDEWKDTGAQDEEELLWMRKHALRGLIKSGHPGAMQHLGYRPDVDITVRDLSITPTRFERGTAAELSVTLEPMEDAPLIVDYVIDFRKANGQTAPKTFKWKVLEASAGKPVELRKKHMFKADATTFKLYPGAHRLRIQINGRVGDAIAFEIT